MECTIRKFIKCVRCSNHLRDNENLPMPHRDIPTELSAAANFLIHDTPNVNNRQSFHQSTIAQKGRPLCDTNVDGTVINHNQKCPSFPLN